MVTLKQDTTKRNLGKKMHRCKICGASGEFTSYLAREMMQGTKDEFVYFVCDCCQCLQIAEIPENLGDYYGDDYYSFRIPGEQDMKFDTPVVSMEKTLDVGCGGGSWLMGKAKEGWGNLYGCDPFLKQEYHYGSRVTILNCSIHEIKEDGTFDYIIMSDSFEHMPDPLEVLQSVYRLLKKDGILIMTMPIYPNIAFEMFGTHWYQLDAPRHIFLHSKKSLKWLSDLCGLSILDITYNSCNTQFIRSYFYENGISYYEQDEILGQYFGTEDLEKLQEEAMTWNRKEFGDHVRITWKK